MFFTGKLPSTEIVDWLRKPQDFVMIKEDCFIHVFFKVLLIRSEVEFTLKPKLQQRRTSWFLTLLKVMLHLWKLCYCERRKILLGLSNKPVFCNHTGSRFKFWLLIKYAKHVWKYWDYGIIGKRNLRLLLFPWPRA